MPRSDSERADGDPSWKERYAELKVRLGETREALAASREALQAADARTQAVRDKLAQVQERLRWHERALLRPEVLADLMPARAAWRRRTPPDAAAVHREATHVDASPSYVRALDAPVPAGAEQVEIGGLTWWVPGDDRRPGRLADRIVNEKRLPFVDILRTREVISNGIMLDIGANIGLTSVTRTILGDVDVVYAAEPAPDNFACLVRTVVENGLRGVVLPDHVAISDHDGSARLRLSGSIGGHALEDKGDGVDVPTSTLDTWVSRLRVDVDAVRYVKVDTQGHESHVLAGATALLARPGVAWELEFSPGHLARAGRSARDLIAQMQAVFTHFVDLTPDAPGGRVRPVAELAEATAYLDRSFTNFLAYRTAR